jgi:hypothetical protein
MAMGYFGNDLIDRSTYQGVNGYTVIVLDNPAAIRGVCKKWGMYMTENGNMKFKIFRDDGTNYVFIGETTLISMSLGLDDDHNCWIPVEKGDFVGYYQSCIHGPDCTPNEGSCVYKSGDITTTTLKSGWSSPSPAKRVSVRGKIFSRAGVL